MDPIAASGSPHDAFARVRAALEAVWPQVRDPSAGPSARERSLMLDECGSDHRPLVELLLDIGRQVRPALVPLSGAAQGADRWANTRAPLVHQLVATRYLQPDVARWAVDVWGRVLGVAPPPQPPVVQSAVEVALLPPPAAGSDVARGHGVPPARPRPAVVSPANVPPALRTVPSWAGGPVSPRVGTTPSALATGGRLVVRGPVPSGPRYQPVERRAAIVLGVLLVAITIALSQALRRRQVDAVPETRTAGTDRGAEQAVVLDADSLAPLPLVRADSTSRPPLVPAPATVDSAAFSASPLAPPYPDRSTRTRSFVDAGVGGRYLVTQRVRDVSGTQSCDAVAQALAAGRETLEVVTHQPGATAFVLATRDVEGTLASDGWFTAGPRSGTTNNVNWQFRMQGRFGRDGFSAVSETYTEAILRWGRTQHCVVTADLTGRRLPG